MKIHNFECMEITPYKSSLLCTSTKEGAENHILILTTDGYKLETNIMGFKAFPGINLKDHYKNMKLRHDKGETHNDYPEVALSRNMPEERRTEIDIVRISSHKGFWGGGYGNEDRKYYEPETTIKINMPFIRNNKMITKELQIDIEPEIHEFIRHMLEKEPSRDATSYRYQSGELDWGHDYDNSRTIRKVEVTYNKNELRIKEGTIGKPTRLNLKNAKMI